jgi:glycosyltransferase involved in cell wall biosynthesis
MDISVVLGTYNRSASLSVTLKSFCSQVCSGGLRWELLVVDNNSTDLTRSVVEAFAAQANFPVRYVFEKRQGRSAALNTGIREAAGEIIAFTDDDIVLDCNWLSNINRAFYEYDCAAVAGRVVPTWNHAKPTWLEMEGQYAVTNFDLGDEAKTVQVPPLGANSAFRKDIFEKYGLFRLDLGVSGSQHTITCDDTEFGERLIRGGEKIVYCPSAVIHHPVDPERTTKKYFLSWYYYNGVSLTRMYGLPDGGISWFGAPRWLYREMLTNLGKWMVTLEGNRRFRYKLQTYQSIGKIVESRRLTFRREATSVSSEQIS